MGILFYSVAQIKNILIPFFGVLTVGILTTCFQLLTVGYFPNYAKYLPVFSVDLITEEALLSQGASLLFLAIKGTAAAQLTTTHARTTHTAQCKSVRP